MRPLPILAAFVVVTGRLAAQTDTQLARAAGTITAASVARHIGVIAHDSMMGRDTPSVGLEMTAQYIANQFRAIGLEPAGDSGTWFQRYPASESRTVDYKRSGGVYFIAKVGRQGRLVEDEEGRPVARQANIDLATDVIFAVDTVLDFGVPGARGGGQASGDENMRIFGPAPIVLAGPHTIESIRQAHLRDKVVFYIPPAGVDSAARQRMIDLLRVANHVVIITDEDSASFAKRHEAALHHLPAVPELYSAESLKPRRWAIYIRRGAIQDALTTAGLDLVEARTSNVPITRELKAWMALVIVGGPRDGAMTAPNTVGILRSSDSNYQQAVVFTAHMDHTGLSRGRADSINNGADDNASGVAGLVELAKALRQSGVRLQRPIIFAAVSGEKNFWGTTALYRKLEWAPGGVAALVNVNLDMIGRPARDSVRVDGLHDIEVPIRPDWLAAQHPEWGITVVDGGTVATAASDHFVFVRNGMPSLYVHNGSHDDISADDSLQAIDTEQEARILRLVVYLGYEIANAKVLPRWTAEGRRQRLTLVDQFPSERYGPP